MSISPKHERRHEEGERPRGKRGSLTVEDYMVFTEYDDKRYELLEGQILMTPSPITRHQRVSGNLYYILAAYIRATGLGELFYAPFDVVLSAVTVCQPDIVFVSKERASIVGEKNIQGAPDLLVEVLSPSTRSRDAVVKREIYAAAGVRHYWILDPEERTLEEYVYDDSVKTFRQGALLDRPDAKFAPAIFPELAIDLAQVWA